MRNFKDRVAVVTGAASGIGRATSVALAERGCDLALADVNELGLTETARAVEQRGRKATTHVVDVASREEMERFVADVLAAHGAAHILVNNAGVTTICSLERHTLEDFEWVVGVNLWGVVYGCKFFLPHLRAQDEAHIVNLSSMFGLIGVPTQSSYCATKFAVRGFSESLRAELAGTAVGVTCVHPGGIRTNIVRNGRYVHEANMPGAGREKLIEFFATKAMPAERAADKIVRAVARGKPRLLITPESYVTDFLKRLMPTATDALVRRGRRLLGR